MNKIALLTLVLALSGCSWIGRQADALGSYMPVIGERCEHWQCMTDEGRAISDAKLEQRKKMEESEAEPSQPAQPEPQLPADPNQPRPLVDQPFHSTGATP